MNMTAWQRLLEKPAYRERQVTGDRKKRPVAITTARGGDCCQSPSQIDKIMRQSDYPVSASENVSPVCGGSRVQLSRDRIVHPRNNLITENGVLTVAPRGETTARPPSIMKVN